MKFSKIGLLRLIIGCEIWNWNSS